MNYLKDLFIKSSVYVIELINSIPKDKLQHFFLGFIHLVVFSLFLNDYEAIAATALAAAFKEVIWDDVMQRGHPSRMDFLWGIFPCALYLIIKLI